ncbi:23841_t:CDS:1, partial [Racocetra persica]
AEDGINPIQTLRKQALRTRIRELSECNQDTNEQILIQETSIPTDPPTRRRNK